MNLLNQLFRLPSSLDYVGYTFHLQLRKDNYNNLMLGYFLIGCHSKNKFKRCAFQAGVWDEKERVVVSSRGSNYLFKVLILDDCRGIETLTNLLRTNGIPLRSLEREALETEYSEINYNLLTTSTI